MGRYDRKGNDHYYPNYKPDIKLKERLNDTLNVILHCLDKKIKEVRLRDLTSDIFEYLERFEGYHYGISEEAYKLIDNNFNSNYITLDHGVPSNVLIKELKSIKPGDRQELLNFFKHHYYMCFITKDEDRELNRNKLKQKMPDGWNGNWNNWAIRYEVVGINLILEPGVINKV